MIFPVVALNAVEKNKLSLCLYQEPRAVQNLPEVPRL